MEHYVFPTKEECQACLDAIHSSANWPIVPMRNGVPDFTAQKVIVWVKELSELQSGEWCFKRIPTSRLDNCGEPYKTTETDEEGEEYDVWKYPGVPQESREEFLAVYGEYIREVSHDEFVPIEEEEV